MPEAPTASQTVGPFFAIGLDAFLRKEAAGGGSAADRVTVHGRMLDGDEQPVPDAVLEIWVPGKGNGATGADGYPSRFARVATNELGEFEFTFRRPSAGEHDGSVHAPHALVLVFMRGLLRHLVTRVYFSDETANAQDPVLQLVPSERRETLIGASDSGGGRFLWDVHLQGERETVFFDV